MKNEDLLKKLTETLTGIMNGSIDSKSAKTITKQADVEIKQQMKELKDLQEISKIAKNQNQTLVTQKQGDFTLHGVPVKSKIFFGNYIGEPESLFKDNGKKYIVVYKSAYF